MFEILYKLVNVCRNLGEMKNGDGFGPAVYTACDFQKISWGYTAYPSGWIRRPPFAAAPTVDIKHTLWKLKKNMKNVFIQNW